MMEYKGRLGEIIPTAGGEPVLRLYGALYLREDYHPERLGPLLEVRDMDEAEEVIEAAELPPDQETKSAIYNWVFDRLKVDRKRQARQAAERWRETHDLYQLAEEMEPLYPGEEFIQALCCAYPALDPRGPGLVAVYAAGYLAGKEAAERR